MVCWVETRGGLLLFGHASAVDEHYILRDLDVTPVCVSCKVGAQPPANRRDQALWTYVAAHPGSTLNDLLTYMPELSGVSYADARAHLVALVTNGHLIVTGQVPLEELDLRYERVALCDVCGASSTDHPIILWKNNTPVVRCTGCGLLYANPRWKATYLFGRYTSEYWTQYAQKIQASAVDPVTNQARWRQQLDSIAAARQTGRLLDVGCASGEFLLAAQACHWTGYGVESSASAADQARRITGGTIHTGTLDTAPYTEGMFDVVTLWDVIEHLQSPRAYVQQIAKLLRPGGLFALTTPNIRSLAFALLGPQWEVVGPNDHLYYFAPRTLARLLVEAGFAIHNMHTLRDSATSWRQWIGVAPLKPLAVPLDVLTRPVVDRFLWGEELYVIARRL